MVSLYQVISGFIHEMYDIEISATFFTTSILNQLNNFQYVEDFL